MEMLTRSETVLVMFQLGILTALWGIYTEVRRMVENRNTEPKNDS